MRTFLLVLLLSALAAGIYAADGDGGYAGAFFQIPIGARPTGMGGAYIGVSNDGAGALFNPAGLVTLERPLFGTSYRFLQLDRKLGYATVIFPIRGESIVGAHWLYAGSGSVQARDADGKPLGFEISENSHVFSILFAKRFEDYISVGAKFNYLQSSLAGMTAFTVGFDFGAMLYVDQFFDRERRDSMFAQDIQIGLTVKQIGADYRWNTDKLDARLPAASNNSGLSSEQKDRVPVDVGLGGSARFLHRKLLVATDVTKNTKQTVRFHGGGEYYLTQQFALRAGYGDKRATAGTGYIFKFGKKTLAIDYAFSTDRADEGSEHIFSFDFLF